MPNISKFFEFRIFLVLGIVALAVHLFAVFGTVFAFFADILLLLFLSWILSFILEPLVAYLVKAKLNRTTSAAIVYLGIAILIVGLVSIVLPTTISQLTQLGSVIPLYLPQNPIITPHLADFLSSTLSNSIQLASQIASGITWFALVFILSFYLLTSKKEISETIKSLVPDDYEDDYIFLESVVNDTFATFIRLQFFLGLILGFITFVTLAVLRTDYALSTSLASAILAMIPVVGPILFLFPPMLAALTISLDKLLITLIVLIFAAQLVFNVLAPKLLGQALKIHPIIVLVSFIVGYKIGGIWGAIFSVPVVSAFTVIGKDVLKYWKQEADK